MAEIQIQRKFIAVVEEEEHEDDDDKEEGKRTENAKVCLAKGYLFVFYRLALMLSSPIHVWMNACFGAVCVCLAHLRTTHDFIAVGAVFFISFRICFLLFRFI